MFQFLLHRILLWNDGCCVLEHDFARRFAHLYDKKYIINEEISEAEVGEDDEPLPTKNLDAEKDVSSEDDSPPRKLKKILPSSLLGLQQPSGYLCCISGCSDWRGTLLIGYPFLSWTNPSFD